MLMKRTAILFLIFICSIATRAQENKDSCSMQISLLTCAPGTDLYSLFGHTAIRVLDTARGMDIVYNYGTFDDSDPLFYVHFTRGIMLYSLSAETFKDFMAEYEYEHRAVFAQVLDLSCAEKNQLYDSLRKNSLEQNRFYQYHFHTDNCTTRAAVIIESNSPQPFVYKNILPDPGPSFRDMIHEYLDRQHQYWSEFGIDMMLGVHLDNKPTNIQAIHFLPDYLYRGMDSAYAGNKPLVIEKKTILQFPSIKSDAAGLTPSVLFLYILILTVILYIFRANSAIAKTLLVFDIFFFSLLGLVGIVMAYTWLGRVDDVCRNNINIIWALPTHLVAVFFIRKNAPWAKYYFLNSAILAAILLIGFSWWAQRMNAAVIPILLIIMTRGLDIFKNRNRAEKSFVQR
jgi:hypothetical protein